MINYLKNRKFYVSINRTKSTRKEIAGILQGSILGLLLFTLYINDLPQSTQTHTAVFADDTPIYTSSWSPTQATRYIQKHQLDQLDKYLTDWKLKIHPNKAQAITFTTKESALTAIKVANQDILWSQISRRHP